MAKRKSAPVEPEKAVTEASVGEFLADNGLLFEINRAVLHPVGFNLRFDGDTAVLDNLQERPTEAVFTPAEFARGRAAWFEMMREHGYFNHKERKTALGYVVQEG